LQESCHHPTTRREKSISQRPLPQSPDQQRAAWPGEREWWWEGQDFDRDYDLADIEMMRQGTWVDFAIGQLLGTGLNIPVGPPVDRRDIELPSLPSILKVVPKPPDIGIGRIFKEATGRRIPQIKEVLPVPAPVALPQVRTGPSSEDGGLNSTSIHTGAREMPDLGHILGGIGDFIPGPDFFDLGANIYNYARPQQIVDTGVGPPAVIAPPAGGGGGGGPVYPVVGQGGACERDPRNDYVMKFSCGQWKWVKKRRRRSKRLATSSDIKDLSSLKGVLGDGKNLSTWIATHR